MSEKTYYFIISIPRDESIEYTTKLNSYISKLFPKKEYPCNLQPMEVRDNDILSKITIKASEEDIKHFADRFFEKNYELTERENGEIEITQKQSVQTIESDDEVTKH